jgi:tRNA(Ile)-lysidine synthase
MNIFRGAGLGGLCGISPVKDGYILRPLLAVSKEGIDEYVAANKIPFVVDESNSDSTHTRNFLRNEVIPLIKKKFRSVENAVINLGGDAKAALDFIGRGMDKNAIRINKDGSADIKTAALKDKALAVHYVMGALRYLGFTRDIDRVHIDSVIALAGRRNGAGIDLPDGLKAVKEYEHIRIYAAAAKTEKDLCAVKFKVGNFNFGGREIVVSKIPPDNAKEKAQPSDENAQQSDESTQPSDKKAQQSDEKAQQSFLMFDINKIPPNAVFRFRRDGDIFKPYKGGAKKLKDYLIDKKIPKIRRDSLVLFADGSEVLAVLGVEISDRIKAEEKSDVYYARIESEW